jgi:tetratricopeptide (TPR) repeat protein
MAPEQFGSAPDLDERADLYAFGVVLYEMLTGRPPFSGKTTRELAQAHLLQQPPRPRARRPELPDALERLVLRCLEKDRESRYPNFAELERQLGRLAAEHGWALPAAVDSVPLQVWEQTNKGSSLVALGHPREGLRCFEAALAGLPNYAPAFNNRGVALRQLGAHYDAVVSFHRALDLNGRYVDAWYNLGVTLGELGSSNRERDCYAKVLELDPRHFESWLNRGISLLEKAVHSGRRMALNGAREALDRALELRGGHAQAHYHRGLVHWLLGNAEPALLDLEIASFADPPWEPAPKVLSLCRAAPAGAGTGAPISLPPPPPLAELLQHGQALEVLGQPFEALALYDEILELHGSAPSLQRYRGDALLALGRIDAAVEAYQAAVGDDPDDWQAVLGWGRALLGRGSLKEALDRFLATTEARPSLTQGWRELARTLEALGRHREALTALERAEFGARQDPEFWGLRARVAMAAGQPLLAARFHARELRLDRSRAASHCARGRALLELRELRRALDAANMALRLEPELPDGWLLLGEVCLARGQPELALTCQRRAARLAPQAPEPTLLQARALRQLGRARSAAHCYQVYLQRRPDDTRIEAELADHLKGAAAR